MSLVTYEDAIPWAQSLQSELIVGTMPPATADVAYGAIKQAQPLAAKYLDVILGDRRLRRLALHGGGVRASDAASSRTSSSGATRSRYLRGRRSRLEPVVFDLTPTREFWP
jgi:hypothetical protein